MANVTENSNGPAFESPVTKTYSSTAGSSSVELRDRSALTKTLVRAESDSSAAATLGVPYGRSRIEGQTLISGQRPTEWLVIGNESAVSAVVAGIDTTGHVSVVDHTHSRALFEISGPDSASVLEKVCSLDFSDHMTPDTAVVSASVAKANCDLIRCDTIGGNDSGLSPKYLIACDRSFAAYLFDALVDAGNEFEMAVR